MLAGSSSFYAGGVKPYDNLLFIIVTSEVPAGYGDGTAAEAGPCGVIHVRALPAERVRCFLAL